MAVKEANMRATVHRLNAKAVSAFNDRSYSMAEVHLSAAISLDETNAVCHANRSVARERRGRYEGALADAESSLACDATYVPALLAKARALLRLRRFPEAAQVARRGLAMEEEAQEETGATYVETYAGLEEVEREATLASSVFA